MDSRQQGLTLLELLIVLAIISILAAISYPVYQQHVLKTRRSLYKNKFMRWQPRWKIITACIILMRMPN